MCSKNRASSKVGAGGLTWVVAQRGAIRNIEADQRIIVVWQLDMDLRWRHTAWS